MKLPTIIKQEPLSVAAGVAKLFKVQLARTPRPVLLKEPLNFWDEVYIANEARLLDEITHPRVRRKLAFDAPAHRLYLEYIEAATLQDLVVSGVTRQAPGRTHRILQGVAETVADLQAGIFCSRPVIHNDLKSLNVLVPAAAPNDVVLIDFSHSYFEGSPPAFITDQKHNPAGTAKYTAPEKWAGDYGHGRESETFAFGVLAYYAYTGRHPFDGEAAPLEQQIREVTPPTPIQLGVNVPRNLQAIVMACLEKSPSQRPSLDYVARCYAESAGLFQPE
jgi:serine/threonine-protein kinase